MFSRRRRSQSKSLGAISRTCIEALEARRLLAAAVWTGDDDTTQFGDRFNWQGDVAPTAGQDIDFPAGANGTAVTVNGDFTVGSIEFDDGYTLSGNGALTVEGNVAVTDGATVIGSPLVLGTSPNINLVAGTSLALGVVSDGGNKFGMTETGGGTLTLQGAGDTYTGVTLVKAGTLINVTSLASQVTVSAGANFIGTGSVASLLGNGGQFSIANGAAAGQLTVADNLTFGAAFANGINFDIDGTGASSEITVNSGAISLGGAQLSGTVIDGYVPTPGAVITLIQNNTGTAINGTFANLAEGATVAIGGEDYQISYIGGNTLDCVTLTAEQTSTATGTSVTLSSSHTPVFEGHTVELTATVTAASGTAAGSVIFYENFTAIPVSQTRFGGTNYTVPLTNGTASLDVATLPVGSDTITATFTPTGTNPTPVTTITPLIVKVRTGTAPQVTSLTPFLSTRGYTVLEEVDGEDTAPAGQDGLTYDWTAVHLPSGAKAPVYDVNDSNLADAVTVRFFKDGGYILRCNVTNLAGNTTAVDVDVTVTQKATTLRVEPHKAQIHAGKTLQYVTTVLDQFNRPMRTAQPLVYSVVSGGASGSINSATGLFSATDIAGPVMIEVADDKLTAMVGAEVL